MPKFLLWVKSFQDGQIGLENDIVRLIPYTNEWKRLFEEEKSLLQAIVGEFVLDIQHVGSTSIPGMSAKPIIDIAIAVKNFEKGLICIKSIEKLGYEYRGENGIARRHFFVKGNPRTHHIHMNELGSRDWNNQILFRNYLIRRPEIAREYADLKIELAKRYRKDRQSYQDGKTSFIESTLQLASSDE